MFKLETTSETIVLRGGSVNFTNRMGHGAYNPLQKSNDLWPVGCGSGMVSVFSAYIQKAECWF